MTCEPNVQTLDLLTCWITHQIGVFPFLQVPEDSRLQFCVTVCDENGVQTIILRFPSFPRFPYVSFSFLMFLPPSSRLPQYFRFFRQGVTSDKEGKRKERKGKEPYPERANEKR